MVDKQPLPKSSNDISDKSTAGLLFAICGRGTIGEPFSSVECYNFRKNTWHKGPELKSRRWDVGVACLGNKIYAVGGQDGTQHLNSVECYDPKVGHWDYVQSMNRSRRGIGVSVLGGQLYAVGKLGGRLGLRVKETGGPHEREGIAIGQRIGSDSFGTWDVLDVYTSCN